MRRLLRTVDPWELCVCVCVFVLVSTQTCNDPVVITHTQSAAENRNEEDIKDTTPLGWGKGPFTVPYFPSQHPLSSRGESLSQRSRVNLEAFLLLSLPWRICSSLCVCVCAWKPGISHSVFTKKCSLIDFSVINSKLSAFSQLLLADQLTFFTARDRNVSCSACYRCLTLAQTTDYRQYTVWLVFLKCWKTTTKSTLVCDWLLVVQQSMQPLTKKKPLTWAKLCYLSTQLHCFFKEYKLKLTLQKQESERRWENENPVSHLHYPQCILTFLGKSTLMLRQVI